MGVPLTLAALGVAALAYGVAMGALYPANGFFLVWVAAGAALLWLAWAARTGAWARLPAVGRRVCVVLAAALVLASGSGCALIWRDAAATPPGDLDYLVVLGASLNVDGSPKETLRFRLDAAADYLAANPRTRCVLSGGQGPDEPRTEASAMAAYLQARGVDEDRLVLEERSTTTAENLRFSRAAIARDALTAEKDGGAATGNVTNGLSATGDATDGIAADGIAADGNVTAIAPRDAPDPSATETDEVLARITVGVVTNDFHVFRAVRLARGQGFSRVWGVSAPTNPLYQPQATLRECAAVLKDALVGNLTL